VLRSSVREFLASEHLHFLGIPTTRALSCVVSSDTVARDIKYDGNVKQEPCAVVLRVAPSFIRFGSFQLRLKDAYNPTRGGDPSKFDLRLTTELADYVVRQFYPHLNGLPSETAYSRFLCEVIEKTLELFLGWQSVGFIHGVLNTDNMSVLGLTIDYGPFGFMEHFDEWQVINTSDEWGRYAYCEQPKIAKWNLQKLLECFEGVLPAASLQEPKALLDKFDASFASRWHALLNRKLGLAHLQDCDRFLNSQFIEQMSFSKVDWTAFFLAFEKLDLDPQAVPAFVDSLFQLMPTFEEWKNLNFPKFPVTALEPLLANANSQMFFKMQMGHFPEAFLTNQYEKGLLLAEYKDKTEQAWREEVASRWTRWLDYYLSQASRRDFEEFEKKLGSSDRSEYLKARRAAMARLNPSFVLRNQLIQDAIRLAEGKDYSGVDQLLELACRPFDRSIEERLTRPQSSCSEAICLSCSS